MLTRFKRFRQSIKTTKRQVSIDSKTCIITVYPVSLLDYRVLPLKSVDVLLFSRQCCSWVFHSNI